MGLKFLDSFLDIDHNRITKSARAKLACQFNCERLLQLVQKLILTYALGLRLHLTVFS